MREYFLWMASNNGRFVRALAGIGLLAWGYATYQYPQNVLLMSAGFVILILAALNWSIFAPLFGYSLKRTKGTDTDNFAFPKNEMKKDGNNGKVANVDFPSQGRPKYSTGTTTQGGSNHGQGSMQLGQDAYKQGSKKSNGANYDNEADKLSNIQDQ
jgi:hypothetical protein